ncbi:unnamed protein product [marine sediment metagenome]|uniref:Uncharacterized protein n=1 Tax=marine sediment metagenome TaxID=412755 RepID=X1MD17_9ZZZZ
MPPRIPKLKLPTRPLEPLREIVRGGRERLEEAGSDIRSIAEEFHGGTPDMTSTTQDTIKAPEIEPQSHTSSPGVSTEETIAYQKRELGKQLLLLQNHLEQGCRIPPTTGEPCDCCSPRHTVTIEALALETYGITGDPIYQDLAKWAEEIERKTTIPEIESGRHNYGEDAVEARKYRKKLLGSESLGALLSPSEHNQIAERATKMVEEEEL